jgi:hypothetical protein
MIQINEMMDAYGKALKQQSKQKPRTAASAPDPVKPPASAPEETAAPSAPLAQKPTAPEKPAMPKPEHKSAESGSLRETILERYRNGEDLKDIAKNLDMGYGEVKLIVELYKGDENT